uniref:Craniofacial development protein 2-like n=1 Tax=Crassostrea virginica TaxID=6565 RepID=A0A8B8D5C5_CRAVI|nr:craniofacial development protein 2-like [Crassostrea virginica]
MTRVDESREEVHSPMSLCTPKDNLYIGSWNVRSMYITGKTAQVEKEMDRYQLDIIGLSEVRWPKNGKTILQSGKVMLYSGREYGLHQEGVGVMLSNRAKKSLMEWKPINERLMYLRLYTSTLKISLIVVYSPTNDNTEETKEIFLEQLQEVINNTPKHDILLIIGDFNAKVGSSNKGYESVMGKHGIGKRNENGENLLELCQINNLVITGTIFPHKPRHKISWISPDGKTENQIDHVLISRQLLDTRAMRGADASSDHELIRSKFRIKLKKQKLKVENRRMKYDATKLQQPEIRKAFSVELKTDSKY